MLKKIVIIISLLFLTFTTGFTKPGKNKRQKRYTVGVGDILEIRLLKPDQLDYRTTVTPEGTISVVYIGTLRAEGKTISQLQREIQIRLSRGYLKYPVVIVTLMESHSQNFTISGEVVRPGTYPLRVNTTVLKAISIAGGFTRFGSKSKVKILRPRKDKPGYKIIKVDLGKVMDGDSVSDVLLIPGDIVIVSESFF